MQQNERIRIRKTVARMLNVGGATGNNVNVCEDKTKTMYQYISKDVQ